MKKNRIISLLLVVVMLSALLSVTASAQDTSKPAAGVASTPAISARITAVFNPYVFSNASYKTTSNATDVVIKPVSQVFEVRLSDDNGALSMGAQIVGSTGLPYVVQLVGTYKGSPVEISTLDILTDAALYTFKVTPNYSVENNIATETFTVNLADTDTLALLTDLEKSTGFISFTLGGSKRTVSGTITVRDKTALANLYNDYIKAGGLNQDLRCVALVNACEKYTIVNGVSTPVVRNVTPVAKDLTYIYLDNYDTLYWYYKNGYLTNSDIAYLYRNGMIPTSYYTRLFNINNNGSGRKVVSTEPNVGGFRRITYSDGSVELIKQDGTSVTVYPDGTQVTTYPDGTYRVVDIDGTIYTADKDGHDVIIYPDGTYVEERLDGTADVIYSDGTFVHIDNNGNETTIGNVKDFVNDPRNGYDPAGRFTIHSDGTIVEALEDGTANVTYPDGTLVHIDNNGNETEIGNVNDFVDDSRNGYDPDGRFTIHSDGTIVETLEDGTANVTYPDGTLVHIDNNGNETEIGNVNDFVDDPLNGYDPEAYLYGWDYSGLSLYGGSSDWDYSGDTYSANYINDYYNDVYNIYEETDEWYNDYSNYYNDYSGSYYGDYDDYSSYSDYDFEEEFSEYDDDYWENYYMSLYGETDFD